MSRRNEAKARLRSIVAFSASFERDPLLRRGLGLDHLIELIKRLARPIVVEGRSIAYAGGWKKADDNFTRVLLDVISSEQDDLIDETSSNPDLPRHIAPLINHLAWPHYRDVDVRTEAEAINTCRVLRVTQRDAGILDPCPDEEADFGSDRAVLNGAITLQAMRRLQVEGMAIPAIESARPDSIPGIAARICIGGKEVGSSGFLPGIWEEALLMLEAGRPLILLGGFGGATHSLAEAFLDPIKAQSTFDPARLLAADARIRRVDGLLDPDQAPERTRGTSRLCDRLRERAISKQSLSQTFNLGLSDADSERLMTTSDLQEAVSLCLRVIRGLPHAS